MPRASRLQTRSSAAAAAEGCRTRAGGTLDNGLARHCASQRRRSCATDCLKQAVEQTNWRVSAAQGRGGRTRNKHLPQSRKELVEEHTLQHGAAEVSAPSAAKAATRPTRRSSSCLVVGGSLSSRRKAGEHKAARLTRSVLSTDSCLTPSSRADAAPETSMRVEVAARSERPIAPTDRAGESNLAGGRSHPSARRRAAERRS